MVSSPRFTRGTSVIAALVFAALLGAVALSLNALQSNSANNAALPAAAAASNYCGNATGSSDKQECKAGCSYTVSVNSAGSLDVKGTQVVDCQAKDSNGNVINASNPMCAKKQGIVYYNCNNSVSGCQQSTCDDGGSVTTGQQQQAMSSPDAQGNPGTGNDVCNPASSSYNATQCQQQQAMSSPSAQGNPGGVTPDSGSAATTIPAGMPNAQGCYPSGVQADGTTPCTYTSPAATTIPQGAPDASGCYPSGVQANGTTACNYVPPAAQPCAAGQTGTPGNCSTPPPGGGGNGGGGAGSGSGGGTQSSGSGSGSSNPLGSLGSLLSGIAKGLTGSTCGAQQQSTSVGGNGTTLQPVQVYNPTTGTYTQTYVQQAPTNALGQPCAAAPASQSAPYGTGSDGNACQMPPTVPQCATGATPMPISATGNGCTTSYQCVPTSSTLGQTPTPQISCSPQTADVGESVAISYSCQNATDSSGSGFSTNDQLSGSASTTITAPPSGTNTANYGLTCTGSGQSASAQCSVQINQPAIDLVADPQAVASGGTATIGWVTAGMKSCLISSPQDSTFTDENASNTNVNGVAQTNPMTQSMQYTLTCTTLGGQTKTATTMVTVGGAGTATSTAADVSVSSTVDGSTVNHGGTVTVTWSDANAASSSVMAIWLIDINSEEATALIASDQAVSGSYTWQIPATGSTCNANSYTACATDLVAGRSYGIEAAAYTPSNAYIGPPASAPANAVQPTYTDYGYTANPFTIGQ